MKLSTSLFLNVNQQTIAKMVNFSLLQNIQRISELRFRYMEFYPSDKVHKLTKIWFAIINSPLSSDRREHWIMIARLDNPYYFAWIEKKNNNSFLPNKKKCGMVS